MNHKVVIVIATYNEKESIQKILDELMGYQIVIVDDNSPDGTGDIAKKYANVHVISRPKKLGLKSAYLEGFRYALKYKPEYVIQMDAGLTHNSTDTLRLLDASRAANSIAIGSRFFYVGSRTIISLLATGWMRILGVPVTDASSGFRCWPTDTLKYALENIVRAEGHAFQLEMLQYAWNKDRRIVEVPIAYILSNSSFRLLTLYESMKILFILIWRKICSIFSQSFRFRGDS